MSWVRLWCKSNCPSGHGGTEEKYVWFDKPWPDDVLLRGLADTFGEVHYGHSERGYKYGFDRVKRLPAKARDTLIAEYEAQRKHATEMLLALKRPRGRKP